MLSKLCIRLVNGASRELVYPLVDSLVYPMVVRPRHEGVSELIEHYTPLTRAIEVALADPLPRRTRLSSRPPGKVIAQNLVQSVQRLRLPQGMDAFVASQYYFRCLSRFFTWIVVVKNRGNRSCFHFARIPIPLLELSYAPERSTRDRQLFYITGGLLARPSERARLEFRESPDKTFVFAAIHDFCPALPWWVYRSSQALAHRFVMWSFVRFLQRAALRKPPFLYMDSFDSPFLFLRDKKIRLCEDFLFLGIMLLTLYLHLESLGGSYDVKAAFTRALNRPDSSSINC
jgi:hypothetical protein